MVTLDEVRALAITLPRTTEALVRGRVKFRVGRIVYLAFSKRRDLMGFAFPKEWREALVTSEPDKFMLPRESDLRYNWVVVRLSAIDAGGDARARHRRLGDGRSEESLCALRGAHVSVLELDTPHGKANAHLHPADEPRAGLVLGHGAAGGVTARDLVAVTAAAREVGVSVVLVEQPYRVAGRRSPAPARQLDAAWTAV